MADQQHFDGSPFDDPEERQVIFATLDSFRQYRHNAHYNITHRRRQNLYALPSSQWKILAAPPINLLNTFNAVDDAIDANADIAEAILELGLQSFAIPAEPERGSTLDWHGAAKPSDMAKAHSTIRQFYRDWSKEGYEAEVEPLLKVILGDLATVSLPAANAPLSPKLLMPGAGLGRLSFSLSLYGYEVEGNEISYHQLLASNFVLNSTRCALEYNLYPFVSTFTNHKVRANQLKMISIPDIHPATTLAKQRSENRHTALAVGSMNMTAGDFLTSYNDPDSRDCFDGVVTVYFVDTAPNLIKYIETVRNCLREDGIWVNIGPLLWHFDDRRVGVDELVEKGEDEHRTKGLATRLQANNAVEIVDTGIAEPGSFELTDEEVLGLLVEMGFEIIKHDYIPTEHGGYIQDPESMIQNRYECSHWVARKVSKSADLQ